MLSQEILLWIKKIITLAIILIIFYAIYLSGDIILTLCMAGFITLLITPLVNKWKKYKIPEWLTILIVYAIIMALAMIVIGTVIPIIANYLGDLTKSVAEWSTTAQKIYTEQGISGFHLPGWIEKITNFFIGKQNINDILGLIKQNAGSIQNFISNQIGNITSG